MKILSFGSCLSRYSVNALQARSDVQLVGAVYHNRIDRFVNHYVDGIEPEPSSELLSAMQFAPGGAARCNLMLDNQLLARKLGHHSIKNQLGFMEALNTEVDAIVMDNFVDLIARLAAPKGKQPSLFMTFTDCANINDLFDIEKSYLDIDVAVEKWHRMVEWLHQKQPNASIVFMNFPFHHHPNVLMQERSKAFAERFQSDKCYVVPDLPVHPLLIDTPSHFKTLQYSMYAGLIEMVVKNRAYIDSKDLNDADAVLRAVASR